METFDTIRLSHVLTSEQQVRWAVLEYMGAPADLHGLEIMHHTALWVLTGTTLHAVPAGLTAPALEDLDPAAAQVTADDVYDEIQRMQQRGQLVSEGQLALTFCVGRRVVRQRLVELRSAGRLRIEGEKTSPVYILDPEPAPAPAEEPADEPSYAAREEMRADDEAATEAGEDDDDGDRAAVAMADYHRQAERLVDLVRQGINSKRQLVPELGLNEGQWFKLTRQMRDDGMLDSEGKGPALRYVIPGDDGAPAGLEPEEEPAPEPEAPAPRVLPFVDVDLAYIEAYLVEAGSVVRGEDRTRWIVDGIDMSASAMLETANTMRRADGLPLFRVAREELDPPAPPPASARAPTDDPEEMKRRWLAENEPSTKPNLGPHEELVLWLKEKAAVAVAKAPNGRWMWHGRAVTTSELYRHGNRERQLRGLPPIKMPREPGR